jgi:hypothetical protein
LGHLNPPAKEENVNKKDKQNRVIFIFIGYLTNLAFYKLNAKNGKRILGAKMG